MQVGENPLNGNEWRPIGRRYSLVSYGDIGKFIRELYGVANRMKVTLNADFDGDVLNHLGLPKEEIWEMFAGFSPTNMLINRTDQTIAYDASALENITIAIFSDT